ncbi:hypothetical protein CEXT_82101 [Caerostris extrusa]|uniref:Uncharacterized protein n=1 Tax=Caerostris extrusa TaxID=172846 RepID=A0AAV4YCM4_CAEEX|nr:hypothetical protein CEXT_82101 [Caerostris extrusa]
MTTCDLGVTAFSRNRADLHPGTCRIRGTRAPPLGSAGGPPSSWCKSHRRWLLLKTCKIRFFKHGVCGANKPRAPFTTVIWGRGTCKKHSSSQTGR